MFTSLICLIRVNWYSLGGVGTPREIQPIQQRQTVTPTRTEPETQVGSPPPQVKPQTQLAPSDQAQVQGQPRLDQQPMLAIEHNAQSSTQLPTTQEMGTLKTVSRMLDKHLAGQIERAPQVDRSGATQAVDKGVEARKQVADLTFQLDNLTARLATKQQHLAGMGQADPKYAQEKAVATGLQQQIDGVKAKLVPLKQQQVADLTTQIGAVKDKMLDVGFDGNLSVEQQNKALAGQQKLLQSLEQQQGHVAAELQGLTQTPAPVQAQPTAQAGPSQAGNEAASKLTAMLAPDMSAVIKDLDSSLMKDKVYDRAEDKAMKLMAGLSPGSDLARQLSLMPEAELKQAIVDSVLDIKADRYAKRDDRKDIATFDELPSNKQKLVTAMLAGIKQGLPVTGLAHELQQATTDADKAKILERGQQMGAQMTRNLPPDSEQTFKMTTASTADLKVEVMAMLKLPVAEMQQKEHAEVSQGVDSLKNPDLKALGTKLGFPTSHISPTVTIADMRIGISAKLRQLPPDEACKKLGIDVTQNVPADQKTLTVAELQQKRVATLIKNFDEGDMKALNAYFGKSVNIKQDFAEALGVPTERTKDEVEQSRAVLKQQVKDELVRLGPAGYCQKFEVDLTKDLSPDQKSLVDTIATGMKAGLPNHASDENVQFTLKSGPKEGEVMEAPKSFTLNDKTYGQPEFLAYGGLGLVVKYTNVQNPDDVVVLKKPLYDTPESRQDLVGEVEGHRQVMGQDGKGNANVVGYHGAVQGTGDKMMMVMDYVRGPDFKDMADVLGHLKASNVLSPADDLLVRQFLARGALDGMIHVQETCDVAHLDLKPQNVMFDAATGTVKVADFGSARRNEDLLEGDVEQQILTTPMTAGYVSPEVLRREEITKSNDTFALGQMIHELVQGVEVINKPGMEKGEDFNAAHAQLADGPVLQKDAALYQKADKSTSFGSEFADVINSTFTSSADTRARLSDLRHSGFFSDAVGSDERAQALLKTISAYQQVHKKLAPLDNDANLVAALKANPAEQVFKNSLVDLTYACIRFGLDLNPGTVDKAKELLPELEKRIQAKKAEVNDADPRNYQQNSALEATLRQQLGEMTRSLNAQDLA